MSTYVYHPSTFEFISLDSLSGYSSCTVLYNMLFAPSCSCAAFIGVISCLFKVTGTVLVLYNIASYIHALLVVASSLRSRTSVVERKIL
jgi:hypothetical protein